MLQDLLEYNHKINTDIILHIAKNEYKISTKTSSHLSHILNAHHIWNSRILNKKSEYNVFQIHPLVEWLEIEKINYKTTLKIIKNESNLDLTIEYKNSKEEAYKNSIKDIIYHVINHSNYHRAQVNSELVYSGLKPVITDYIFYKR